MITKERIIELAGAHLNNGPLFLTRVSVGPGNTISVSIDGDAGVSIEDCVALSRAIESGLNRNAADFSLDVSSHGASSPLLMPRQYTRHIGRDLEVKLTNGDLAGGTMVACNPEGIVLEYQVRENKPIGKGKINVVKQQAIAYNQIKESKIKLKF